MREILFRGKSLGTGDWVDGSLFVDDKKEKHEILVGYVNYRVSWEVDPATVGQFTGMTDKNGQRIFEGDICLCNRNIAPSVDEQGFEIYFDVDCGQWCGEGFSSSIEADQFSMCEIIGNIHDNPELLEVGNP